MKNNIFNTITIYLILVIATSISLTYLSEYLVEVNWFGDKISRYSKVYLTGRSNLSWGARHYIYNWGLFISFIVSLVRLIFYIRYINNRVRQF